MKTKWRLSELPTPAEVGQLVRDEILTKEEAREILISKENDEDRDKKSLQGEIKFLRELVEKLSSNRKSDIIREITVIEKPYRQQPWFQPYYYFTNANTLISSGTNAVGGLGSSGTVTYTAATNSIVPPSFSDIKTF